MLKHLTEGTVLFSTVLKSVALATAVGAIVGLSAAVSLKALNWSTAFSGQFPSCFLILSFAFSASAIIVKCLAPDAAGHGTERVVEVLFVGIVLYEVLRSSSITGATAYHVPAAVRVR